MQHFIKKLTLLSVLSVTPVIAIHAAPETYTLDNTHTAITFHVNHFGFSNPSGKWMADGTLVLDEEKPENSTVNITIKVADIVTGVPKLDEHLQAKDFFNVAAYPAATFVSDKVEIVKHGKGKSKVDKAKVHGTLKLLGVSKPVVLDVKLNKAGVNPINNKKTVGFSATTTLKRSDFGMGAYIPDISNEVKIEIEAEANQ
ncbi:MAG: yceI 1 [Gammaproteobacteria bacterium]|nr:yceI 1 [Gammaproteobacteria bacterium]